MTCDNPFCANNAHMVKGTYEQAVRMVCDRCEDAAEEEKAEREDRTCGMCEVEFDEPLGRSRVCDRCAAECAAETAAEDR